MSVIEEAKQLAKNGFVIKLAEKLKPTHLTISGWKDTPFYQMTINNLDELIRMKIINIDKLLFNEEQK